MQMVSFDGGVGDVHSCAGGVEEVPEAGRGGEMVVVVVM
jgi:hypothetical protein